MQNMMSIGGIVPNKFNMVDMGGIDILESQGISVDGLYERLLSAISNCRYQCLYNWRFDGIEIPPTYVEMTVPIDKIKINEYIWVDQEDVIHIYSIEPPPVLPVIEPLTVNENGEYNVPEGIDGFNPVTVEVEQNAIETISQYAWSYSGWAGWAIMKTLGNVVKGGNLDNDKERTLEGDIINFTYYGGTTRAPYITAKTAVQLRIYQTSITTDVISPTILILNAGETHTLSILNYSGGYYIEASEVN